MIHRTQQFSLANHKYGEVHTDFTVYIFHWIQYQWRVNKWVESIEEIILTDENGSTRRKTCTIVTLSFTNRTRTDGGLNPILRSDMSRLTAWDVAWSCWQMACSDFVKACTRVGNLIVATIYLQLTQNRYMFRSFTVLQCSHQHCVQPVASDVEVVGYL